ncbi:MAG: TIGR00282 family metallophosphoesterase [Rhodospirillaceae bacterium]|nr:TIGR00282 family metallophosphoesterase [Rhodospirillaceae bacterium]|tara:strand:- start:730 stop:1545 length:816 start_codon:yes stop_codon:yes gene_type:complete
MRLLFLGDIVGKSGRKAVLEKLPDLRSTLEPDFIVVNGENAAGGFGINEDIADELFDNGVDVITSGNHVWDQREIVEYVDREPRLLRPINYPLHSPGNGSGLFQTSDGRRVLVINVMLRLFMDPLDDPFAGVEKIIENTPLAGGADFIFIDMHGEATSEKMAFGHNFDGRVTAIIGTHTHVPTADYMVLAAGTAYQTDAGMCGDFDSVIGMKKEGPVRRFVSKLPGPRLEPANGEATVCGALIVSDDRTGLAVSIEPIRCNGLLSQTYPKR